MKTYEYVLKAEYAPGREKIEQIIRSVQIEVWETYQIRFAPRLIGNRHRHLVTKIIGGGNAYQFAYNLILSPRTVRKNYEAERISEVIIQAFEHALEGTEYTSLPDTKSSFAIRVTDAKNPAVTYDCEFCIMYLVEQEGYCYLRKHRDLGVYEFVFRELRTDVDKRARTISAIDLDGWNRIRDDYLKLKNSKEGTLKGAYSLYIEAVNNVYHQIFDQGIAHVVCQAKEDDEELCGGDEEDG